MRSLDLLPSDLSQCPVCGEHGNGIYIRNSQGTDLVHLACRDEQPLRSLTPFVPEVSRTTRDWLLFGLVLLMFLAGSIADGTL